MTALSVDFNKYKIEENNEQYYFRILPGCYCVFNSEMPTNGLHSHKFYELCVVTEGEGSFVHGSNIMNVKKGDVFIADPYIEHEIKVTDSGYLKLIYFSLEISALSKDCSFDILKKFVVGHTLICSNQQHILLYISFIEQYHILNLTYDYGIYQGIRSLILECLDALSKNDNTDKNKHNVDSSFNDALRYIDNNLDKKLKIPLIAQYAGISVRKLQYMFAINNNTTATAYITQRKMLLAGNYLRMNFNVNEVGRLVGFEDPSQFCRAFKKYYGISPKNFKARQRG